MKETTIFAVRLLTVDGRWLAPWEKLEREVEGWLAGCRAIATEDGEGSMPRSVTELLAGPLLTIFAAAEAWRMSYSQGF